MADTRAEGLARERAHRQFLIDLARDLFGWQWRDDWQCWCPPGWPSRDVINPPYLDKLKALQQHGAPRSVGAGTDHRGRPIIPDYRYDPVVSLDSVDKRATK